jgi:hypothetical protein
MSEPSYRSILLFSFLDDIKQKDKKAFIVVVACIVLQLLLTFTKIEAVPFFLFGMYSEKFHSTDTMSKVMVLFNDRPVESFDIPTRQKELVESTATNYVDMMLNNNTDVYQTRIESRYPTIYESPVYPFFTGRIYNTEAEMSGFRKWLGDKRRQITGNDSGNVKILRKTYTLNQFNLQPTALSNEILDVF